MSELIELSELEHLARAVDRAKNAFLDYIAESNVTNQGKFGVVLDGYVLNQYGQKVQQIRDGE